jgi:hypothetical protein
MGERPSALVGEALSERLADGRAAATWARWAQPAQVSSAAIGAMNASGTRAYRTPASAGCVLQSTAWATDTNFSPARNPKVAIMRSGTSRTSHSPSAGALGRSWISRSTLLLLLA